MLKFPDKQGLPVVIRIFLEERNKKPAKPVLIADNERKHVGESWKTSCKNQELQPTKPVGCVNRESDPTTGPIKRVNGNIYDFYGFSPPLAKNQLGSFPLFF